MSVRAWGQLYIQATAPEEDPVVVGSVWVDTSGAATAKVCTAISPYTFAALSSGTLTDHDHTSTSGDGGVLTNEEHDGYSDYTTIATPSAPAAGHKRLYARTIQGKTFTVVQGPDGRELVLSRDNVILVRNTTGGGLTQGQVVYINGASGNTPTVALADASDANKMPAIGSLFDDISDNGFGRVMVWGRLAFDTSGFLDGDSLYVSAVTPGGYTATAPSLPNIAQRVAIVGVSGVGNGRLIITQTSIRTPLGHHTSHEAGGGDAIKLDDLAAPDDNTDLNASTSAHGLVVKATAPASGLLSAVGIGNGETAYSMKPLFDTTNPAALGTAAPGTALVAARRDHVHTLPAIDATAAATDITTRDVTSTAHGLTPKSPGDATKFLNGGATPAWSVPAGGTPDPGLCQGRLTLTTGVPVTTADVTGATTMYFTPFNGSRLALYDGVSVWTVYTFTELSLALGTLTSGKPYDVFVYDNAGTPTLEFLVWTNDTTRATALTTQNGVYVKTGATTRRYLGTFYTTSTTTTEDSAAKRLLWNQYNRVPRQLLVLETTNSWNYTIATWRQARATGTNQLEALVGNAEDITDIDVFVTSVNTANDVRRMVSIGVDSTTTPHANAIRHVGSNVFSATDSVVALTAHSAKLRVNLAAGRHTLVWLEFSPATGTTTWYGDDGGSPTTTGPMSGIAATHFA